MGKQRKGPFTSIFQIDRGPLKRVLRISDLFGIGYGDLGSSIFYALGITAMFALGATPLAMGAAGLIFICTCLSYAEMTSIFQESGGSASFTRHAFNDLFSFVAGWGLLLDYIVTIAISAFTIGPYLTNFFPVFEGAVPKIILTVGVIAVLFTINLFGVKQSTRMSFFLMVFTVSTEVFLIVLGVIYAPDFSHVFKQMQIGLQQPWSPSWDDFIRGIAMAMVAYTGIESMAQLAAETINPKKTVPKSILLTMVVLVVIYLSLSIIALALITPHELGFKYTQHPIEAIAASIPFLQKILVPWISVLAIILLFVASNAGIIGASRLSFNMGEYYQLPQFFYKIHNKFRTPYVSLAFFAIAASLVVIASRGMLSFLADLYNFGAQIAFFSTHLSLIVMRVKKPNLQRAFKVPFNIRLKGYEIPIPAILGALSTLGVWLLVVFTKPEGRVLGFSWLGFGLLMYIYYRRKRKIPAMAQVKLEKISLPEFQPLSIKHILLPVRGGTQTETVQFACELAKLHNAKITALHVVEVPFSLPLETPLGHRIENAGIVLKTVEAIGNEHNISLELQLLKARSIADAVLELVKTGKYDLLVVGAMKSSEQATHKGLGPITERILHESSIRVWVCGTDYSNSENEKGILLKVPH